jgi:hypothetical protein
MALLRLPALKRLGEFPEWDTYLRLVYHGTVPYPFELSQLHWVYRCNCLTMDPVSSCSTLNASHAACHPPRWGNPPSWEASCIPAGVRSPLAGVLPKVYKAHRPECGAPTSAGRLLAPLVEAYVGRNNARLPLPYSLWPNPEWHLAPFGVWLHPRHVPTVLTTAWVEVIRVREQWEPRVQAGATFFYYAPGSGIWLALGRTISMLGSERRKDKPFGATWSATWARGKGFDTLQRPAPGPGHLFEIMDVRPSARQQRNAARTCSGEQNLRVGWNSTGGPCLCDEQSMLLNCGLRSTN